MLEIILLYAIFASVVALILNGIVGVFSRKAKRGAIISTALFLAITIISAILIAVGYNALVLGIIHIYQFSLLFVLLFSITMMMVNILAFSHSKDYDKLLLLFAFSFTGLTIIATANSAISIFLGLELVAVPSAMMILFEGKHRVEAAIKFFILSSVAIAIFSFALALLLPFDPQLGISAAMPNANIAGISLLFLSLVLFVAALGFDTALFPFNLWVPDVYEGSPTYITAMLAGINKKAAFAALIVIFFIVLLPYSSTFSPIFAVLAILTMFFGNILALVQTSVKRMFAYSSIAQAGYIIIGIAAATEFSLEASIFYIIAHAFMIIGAFAIVMWLESKNIRTIDEYNGLSSRSKFAAVSLTILMLSMAGVPPLIGFTGKLLLFSSALSANLALLAVIGIINSFISIYYYAKVMNAMYSRKTVSQLRIEPYIATVVLICVLFVIIFGIFPQPILAAASGAARSVFGI
jgi:proton-translocating NADH-quinone oxidoreductase chain N